MRSLTSSHRLQALSIPEVTDAIDLLELRYARAISFQGRKLRAGPMLNAIVLHFLSLPETEQKEILVEGVKRLEDLLAKDVVEPKKPSSRPKDPDPATGLVPAEDIMDQVVVEDLTPPKSRPRKRNHGA